MSRTLFEKEKFHIMIDDLQKESYSRYLKEKSLDELIDIKSHIDKEKYKEKYDLVEKEIISRDNNLTSKRHSQPHFLKYISIFVLIFLFLSFIITIIWMILYENLTGYSAGNAPFGWLFIYAPLSVIFGFVTGAICYLVNKKTAKSNKIK